MRILLVSHEASRSGAPRVAALVARCLVAGGHRVRIVSRTQGPLLKDFAAEAPTRVEFMSRVRRRLRAMPGTGLISRLLDTAVVAGTILVHRPDLVYINSTAASSYVRPARFMRRRVLLHSHESGRVAERFLVGANVLNHLDDVELVACSPSVWREFADVSGRPSDSIHMIPSVPDDSRVLSLAAAPSEIDGDELVVGCCGSVEARKGADLWTAAAHHVRRALPDTKLRFVWVGDLAGQEVAPDPEVEFLGSRANPYPLMRSFDIATLPSRDDPFPLVVLEAMILGKPVVAFAVGAVADQIGSAGVLVPPEDVSAFAKALIDLLSDEELRRSLGRAAAERASARFSTAAFARELATVIETSAR